MVRSTMECIIISQDRSLSMVHPTMDILTCNISRAMSRLFFFTLLYFSLEPHHSALRLGNAYIDGNLTYTNEKECHILRSKSQWNVNLRRSVWHSFICYIQDFPTK